VFERRNADHAGGACHACSPVPTVGRRSPSSNASSAAAARLLPSETLPLFVRGSDANMLQPSYGLARTPLLAFR